MVYKRFLSFPWKMGERGKWQKGGSEMRKGNKDERFPALGKRLLNA